MNAQSEKQSVPGWGALLLCVVHKKTSSFKHQTLDMESKY